MFKLFFKTFALLIVVLFSCSRKSEEVVVSDQDSILLPSLHSEGVTTLISDSGVTKYRIITKIWEVYDKDVAPYWYFPEKIFVEKFDSVYNTEASIAGDTAYFFSNEKLWQIIGNVVVINQKQERFLTDELFWDQKKQKVYSDKFIRIEQPDRIIEGIGFESTEDMSKYHILETSAIFNVKDEAPESKKNEENISE